MCPQPRILAVVVSLCIAAAVSEGAMADSYGFAYLHLEDLVAWKGGAGYSGVKTDRYDVGTQWDVSDFSTAGGGSLTVANNGDTSANLGSVPSFVTYVTPNTGGGVDTTMSCQGNCALPGYDPNNENVFAQTSGSDFTRGDNQLTGAMITGTGGPSSATANMVAEWNHTAVGSDSSFSYTNLATTSSFKFTAANNGQTFVIDLLGAALANVNLGNDVSYWSGSATTYLRIKIQGPDGSLGGPLDGQEDTYLDWSPGIGIGVGTLWINGGDSLNPSISTSLSGPSNTSEGNLGLDFWRAESLALSNAYTYSLSINSYTRVQENSTIVEIPPEPTPAPEPTTLSLFGVGLLGAASIVRRRRRTKNRDA